MKRCVSNRLLIGLIVTSLLVLSVGTVLVAGIENTPSNTVNSHGRPMGFNDHLDLEHYAIMVQNFHPRLLLNFERAFDWLAFAVHFFGLFLVGYPHKRAWQWFFGLQLGLAPVAVFGCFVLLADGISILGGSMDREGFLDIPSWNLLVALPIWMTACVLALARAREFSVAAESEPCLAVN